MYIVFSYQAEEVRRVGLLLIGNRLFGTTAFGGPDDAGSVFGIDADGSDFQTLGEFVFDEGLDISPDGDVPESELIAIGNSLFGTATFGGADEFGTVFNVPISEPATLSLLTIAGLCLMRRCVCRAHPVYPA